MRYVCKICGFVYDEAVGLAEPGVPAGTCWEAIPEAWHCPKCAAPKAVFAAAANSEAMSNGDLGEKHPGEMAEICRSLCQILREVGDNGETLIQLQELISYLENDASGKQVEIAKEIGEGLAGRLSEAVKQVLFAVKAKWAEKDQRTEQHEKWMCSICGHIHEGAFWKEYRCPVCHQPSSVFFQI